MSRIKNFDDFSPEGNELNEGLWDDITGFFGKLLPAAGEGLTRTIKQKITSAIIEKIGVKENTMLSGLVQEIVSAIPIKDLPGIITGSKGDADYLAPLLAEATQNFIQRKGLEEILGPLGAEPNGWLVATVRNSIQGQIGKEKIEEMYRGLLGAKPFGEGGLVSKFSQEEKEKFANSLTQQAMRAYPQISKSVQGGSQSAGNTSVNISDMIKNLFSGSSK